MPVNEPTRPPCGVNQLKGRGMRNAMNEWVEMIQILIVFDFSSTSDKCLITADGKKHLVGMTDDRGKPSLSFFTATVVSFIPESDSFEIEDNFLENTIYLHEAKDDLAIEDDCGVLVQSLDSCCHPEEAVDLIRSNDAASGHETMVDN